MKIYIVRHGESVDMANNVYQSPKSKLSERGLLQAQQIASRLSEIHFDEVWSSPLERAKQTANVITKINKADVIFEPLLEEERRPAEVVGKTKDSLKTKALLKEIKTNYFNNHKHSDEENFEDMKRRTLILKEKLEKSAHKSILLVTHGNISRMLLAVILFNQKLNADLFTTISHAFSVSKTGLSILRFENDKWKVEVWNNKSHLAE